MNCHVKSPGQLTNQLCLLYHIYSLNDKIDSIYAPRFDEYKSYFNIDDKGILCDSSKEPVKDIDWGDQRSISEMENLFDPKFDDLKLKKPFEDKVNDIVNEMGKVPLVAVHFRLGDYKDFYGGKFLFSVDHYMRVARQFVKDCGLTTYKFIFFSDSDLPILSEGVLASTLTNNIPAIDLFLMGHCNYFVHTWSTFALFAIHLSKSSGKFKNNALIQ